MRDDENYYIWDWKRWQAQVWFMCDGLPLRTISCSSWQGLAFLGMCGSTRLQPMLYHHPCKEHTYIFSLTPCHLHMAHLGLGLVKWCDLELRQLGTWPFMIYVENRFQACGLWLGGSKVYPNNALYDDEVLCTYDRVYVDADCGVGGAGGGHQPVWAENILRHGM